MTVQEDKTQKNSATDELVYKKSSAKREWLVVAGVLVVAFIIATLLFVFKPRAEKLPPKDDAPLAEFVVANEQQVSIPVFSQGSINAKTHIKLVAEVSGRIKEIAQLKSNGGFFKKGELLLSVDDVDYRLAITKARALVSSAEQQLAKKIFGELDGKTVMLVGAGEMAELAARHLLGNGVEHIIVANRTYENAVKLSEEFGGSAVPFDELDQQMELADIVISSTGAPNIIIDKKMVQGVIKRRRNKPMFFIDIAVPRDIDPTVNQVENVYAYDVDDLEGVVEANIKTRSKEAAKAEEIVNGEVQQFNDWMRSRESFPTIVALREWAENVRRSELEKTLKRIEGLSESDTKKVEAMTEAILNKILHRPVTRMKRAAHQGDEGKVVSMVRDIFDIEE